MTVSRYVQRVGRLPQVLDVLSQHPDGLSLADLAAVVGTDPGQLREDVLAWYRVDLVEYGIEVYQPPVVEFVGSDGRDDDPHRAEVLRVVSRRPERELGVEHLSAGDLATLYRAGRALLALEPDNADLAGALAALERSLLPDAGMIATAPEDGHARRLASAARDHRRVRVVYARAWHPGVRERVLEPYGLTRTRRGWEVDAGPRDDRGRIRTYLVSGIREVEVLDHSFVPPADVDELIEANRRRTSVVLVVPQSARWAVDRFAERVEVVQEDEDSVKLRAEMLPPVSRRVGLLLITAGPDAYVMEPADLREAGAAVAAELLEHHRRV